MKKSGGKTARIPDTRPEQTVVFFKTSGYSAKNDRLSWVSQPLVSFVEILLERGE